jgi:hypothetical protein
MLRIHLSYFESDIDAPANNFGLECPRLLKLRGIPASLCPTLQGSLRERKTSGGDANDRHGGSNTIVLTSCSTSRRIPAPAIFFIAGLLYLLCFEHVDNLGAYSIPSETGLLIPSVYANNLGFTFLWSPHTVTIDPFGARLSAESKK